jgi:hypothetical protein
MLKSNDNDDSRKKRLSRLNATKRTLPRDELVSSSYSSLSLLKKKPRNDVTKIIKTQNFASYKSRIELETIETTSNHSKRRLSILLNRLYERVNHKFNSTKSLVLNDSQSKNEYLFSMESLRKFHHWTIESVFKLKELGFECKTNKKRFKSSFQSKILEKSEYALYVDWLDSKERNHVLSHECIHKFEKQRRLLMLVGLEENFNAAKGMLNETRLECLSSDAILKLYGWAIVSMLKLKQLI